MKHETAGTGTTHIPYSTPEEEGVTSRIKFQLLPKKNKVKTRLLE
jgi:hypothetical protein